MEQKVKIIANRVDEINKNFIGRTGILKTMVRDEEIFKEGYQEHCIVQFENPTEWAWFYKDNIQLIN